MTRFTVNLGIDIDAKDPIDAVMQFQNLINGPNPGWDFEVTNSKTGKTETVEYTSGFD